LTLLKIRFIQIKREIKLLGILYTVLISLALLLAIFQFYKFYQREDIALYIITAILLFILSIQLTRQDKYFLFLHIAKPKQSIFFEYLILTLPFTISLLLSHYWFYFVIFLLGFFVISGIKYSVKKKTNLGYLSKIISPKNFEWISGIRQSKYVIGIFYILILAVSYVMILPILCLWILTMIIFSFYRECEPLNILQAEFTKQARFLKVKIIRHIILLLFLYLPILIINSVSNPHFIFFNITFLFVQLSVLVLTILFKYKMYSPMELLPGNNIILVIIQVATILPFFMGGIPFLLPLPLFLCFKYYRSAKENLKIYLYD